MALSSAEPWDVFVKYMTTLKKTGLIDRRNTQLVAAIEFLPEVYRAELGQFWMDQLANSDWSESNFSVEMATYLSNARALPNIQEPDLVVYMAELFGTVFAFGDTTAFSKKMNQIVAFLGEVNARNSSMVVSLADGMFATGWAISYFGQKPQLREEAKRNVIRYSSRQMADRDYDMWLVKVRM